MGGRVAKGFGRILACFEPPLYSNSATHPALTNHHRLFSGMPYSRCLLQTGSRWAPLGEMRNLELPAIASSCCSWQPCQLLKEWISRRPEQPYILYIMIRDEGFDLVARIALSFGRRSLLGSISGSWGASLSRNTQQSTFSDRRGLSSN